MLTLTATPIPRTLHMSLAGLRDISVIETPPEDRRAGPHLRRASTTSSSCTQAIERELRARRPGLLRAQPRRDDRRDGRARCASSCPRRASPSPTARWTRSELEDGDARLPARRRRRARVHDDHRERASTSRSANTMIVDRADRFGLAQLYQIRGRVGRSRERAYAYLLVPAARPRSRRGARSGCRALVATSPSSARASRSRCATSRSAAPATCSATSSRATSRRSASSSTCRCSTRRCAALGADGERGRDEREPVRLDVNVDAYVPGRLRPLRAGQDRRAPPDRRRARGGAS